MTLICSSIFISNKYLSLPGSGGGLVGQAGAMNRKAGNVKVLIRKFGYF